MANIEKFSSGGELMKRLGVEETQKEKFEKMFDKIENGILNIADKELNELKNKLQYVILDKKAEVTQDYLIEKGHIVNETRNNVSDLQSNLEKKADEKYQEITDKELSDFKILGFSISWLPKSLQDTIKEVFEERVGIKREKESLEKKKEDNSWFPELSWKNTGKVIIGAILGAFGIDKAVDKVKGYRDEIFNNGKDFIAEVMDSASETVSSIGNNLVEGVKDSVGGEKEEEKNKEKGEEEKEKFKTEIIDKTKIAGYTLLSKLSGLPYEKGGSTIAILSALEEKDFSILDIKGKLISNQKGDFKKSFGLEGTRYENEEISRVLVLIIGPFNESFLKDQLSEKSIIDSIGQKPNFTKSAQNLFTNDELSEIEKLAGDYERIPLGILSRLTLLSIKTQISYISDTAASKIPEIKTFFKDILKEEIVKDIFKNEKTNIYPFGVSLSFSSILTSHTAINSNAQEIIQKGNDKLKNNNKKVSKEDEEIIKKIVSYKENILNQLDSFNLGLNEVNSKIINNITWQNIINLYIATGGKELNSLKGFGKIIGYTWIYGILDGNIKGKYENMIFSSIVDKGNNDSKILKIIAFRVLELDNNKFFNYIEKLKGNIDMPIETIVGMEDSLLKDIVVNLIEVGAISILLKVLARLPITRAVLIATTGVMTMAIILGIKQYLYRSTGDEINTIYMNFLEEISPKIGVKNASKLIESVNNGSLNSFNIMEKLAKIPENTMEGYVKDLVGYNKKD